MGCQPKSVDESIETGETIVELEPVGVKVESVKKHIFSNNLRLPGEVVPFEEIMITSKVGGDIKLINVEVGQHVEKGQVLGNIDEKMYGLTRKKAELAVNSAKLNLDDAKKQFDNYSVLYKENAVSKSTYEIYEKALKLNEIALEMAKTDYESASENYEYTSIKSPIKGIVSHKGISVGENINMGSHLFTVVSTEKVYIEAGITESNVNKLNVGMLVNVELDSLQGSHYKGEVTHIGPVPGPTNTYPVKILIENSESVIKSGMYATAKVELGKSLESIAVPKKAVQHDNGQDYVLIADGNNAKRLNITIGLSDEDYYQVLDGVNTGEEIIVSGQDIVKSGEPIIIQN